MPKRILSVAYDQQLLTTRRWLLERAGYEVTSALGLAEAVVWCQKETSDLFIIGHSIPSADTDILIKTFRRTCPAPVLSLRRQGDPLVAGADYHGFSDSPAALLEAVETILAKGETGPEAKTPSKSRAQGYTVLSAESKNNQEKGNRRS
jgi:DNA-binding NtrC family response regulator